MRVRSCGHCVRMPSPSSVPSVAEGPTIAQEGRSGDRVLSRPRFEIRDSSLLDLLVFSSRLGGTRTRGL